MRGRVAQLNSNSEDISCFTKVKRYRIQRARKYVLLER
jgi:hypothetical protein